jgi:hypothetical protein
MYGACKAMISSLPYTHQKAVRGRVYLAYKEQDTRTQASNDLFLFREIDTHKISSISTEQVSASNEDDRVYSLETLRFLLWEKDHA